MARAGRTSYEGNLQFEVAGNVGRSKLKAPFNGADICRIINDDLPAIHIYFTISGMPISDRE
jgi:hypothetical protein